MPFPSRSHWRQWLQKNHRSADSVWLLYYKKDSGQPSVTYNEAVEEALCFGWIDSTVRPVDADRWSQRFTPRKPKSVWSKWNKSRVEKMTAAGLMTEAGMAAVATARTNGAWTSIDASENGVMPPDLKKALASRPTAKKHFMAFPPSARKYIFEWIYAAKRPETRTRRIEQTVSQAALNLRARG
ncbi:MAG: YdeI/OmpD-associated family protein [Candidatus Methylacidiphilales bacterium]|nr:YdeI/OmpD-associated family protein [Candidatus Methylacidiphilales bacterium]